MLREHGATKRGRGMRMLSVKVSTCCRGSRMHSVCCARTVLLSSLVTLFMSRMSLLCYLLYVQVKQQPASTTGAYQKRCGLCAQVVLEQLEGSCAEWKEDLAALKTALATVQPLSAAETTEKYKQHLAHQKEDKAQRSWPEQLEQALLLAKGKPAADVRDNVQHQIDEAQGNTAGIASDARLC